MFWRLFGKSLEDRFTELERLVDVLNTEVCKLRNGIYTCDDCGCAIREEDAVIKEPPPGTYNLSSLGEYYIEYYCRRCGEERFGAGGGKDPE